MTAKRFTETLSTGIVTDNVTGKEYNCEMRIDDKLLELLNKLHEENQSLKFDNKELIRFITSKGYTLQDYIKFIGQFQSVGVNKEDWE